MARRNGQYVMQMTDGRERQSAKWQKMKPARNVDEGNIAIKNF